MLRKLSSFVLILVAMVFLLSLTVGVAGGDSHIITEKYNNVDPDGYWTAEVPAGEYQQWNFDLVEPRDHNILMEIVDPPGASLDVSMDGENLGSASSDESLFTVSLEAGSHAVTITNSGDVPVQYDFYMGVSGNQPPDCTAAIASPSVVLPPNHKFVTINVTGVTDPDFDPVFITITSITQDEPVGTSPDGRIGAGFAEVRAERTGGGNGRVYHISFTANDAAIGECSDTVVVSVPRNGKSSAVDDGQFHNSTIPTP